MSTLYPCGNGTVLAYLRGMNVEHFYADGYSSPQVATIRWSGATSLTEGSPSSIGQHGRVYSSARGEVRSYVDAKDPLLIQQIRSREPVSCTIDAPCADGGWVPAGPERAPGAWIAEILPGETVFAYPSSTGYFLAAWTDAGAHLTRANEGRTLAATVQGHGTLYLAATRSYRQLAEVTSARDPNAMIDAAQTADRRLRDRIRIARGTTVTAISGMDDDLWQEAGALIVAQQGVSGGIVAGHAYPLAYGRDQYGTCLGLLALGLHQEVAQNLEFRLAKWHRYGDLANAESLSGDLPRHVHENDDVELTSYLVLQAIAYSDATGDESFLDRSRDMLRWCIDTQLKHLAGGALPFNGDETYVAGGFLPRRALNDGSFESTILFAECLRAALARPRLGLHPGAVNDYAYALGQIEASFEANFLRGEAYVANSLRRAEFVTPPTGRRGVCENCLRISVETLRTPLGYYLCSRCGYLSLPPRTADERSITSAALLPALIGTPLVPTARLRALVRESVARFEKVGYLPVTVGSEDSVGYDEGLLLRALADAGDPAAGPVAQAMLRRRDEHGGWAEYYSAGIPRATRCRPWETGLNIAALAHLLLLGETPAR